MISLQCLRYFQNIHEADKKPIHETALLLSQVVPFRYILPPPLIFTATFSLPFCALPAAEIKKTQNAIDPALHFTNYYILTTTAKKESLQTKRNETPTSCGSLRIHRATNRADL